MAFGRWEAHWTKSTPGYSADFKQTGPTDYGRFEIDPNLPAGRITKHTDGMQTTVLSGHNLVRIVEMLYAGTSSEDLAHSARCKTLYDRFAGFLDMVDPTAPAGKTTGIQLRIDDSLDEQFVSRPKA